MKIEKLPEIIKDIKEEDLLRAIFYHSINSLLHSSIEIHRRHNVIYPFVIEAVYEYFMMFNENGSNTLTPELFGDINLTIFRLPKMMLDKYGTDNIMTLFYLWQIEDQSYIFQKLYRYDWLFHFKNKKIDVSKVFKDKFGCDYIAFEIFCILMVSISVSTRDANTLSLWAYCNNVKNTIISTYQSVVKQLTITRGEYKKASAAVCGNQNLLTFSLKISKLYPFITNERGLICPMPHTIIPACTSSLLFRLTEGDDILHGLISKEALEEYCYHLFSSQPYYSLVRREKGFGKNSLSSDVLLVENDILYCIEVKAFTPNTKTRLMNSEELNTQVDIVVEDLFELYRFLFINYPNNDDLFSKYDINNRFGILALRGDASFNRRILYSRLFDRIAKEYGQTVDEQAKKLIIRTIKISCLDELETAAFTCTRISTIVSHYNTPGHEMDLTAQSVFNKYRSLKCLKEYEEKIHKLSESLLRFLTNN